MTELSMDLPSAWIESGLADLSGLVMVIGAPNTGKTTLAGYIYGLYSRGQSPAAFLDGDPGQSSLGPPTTITLAMGRRGEAGYPPKGSMLHKFVASTTPKGHMLPLLVGAGRLVDLARQMGCNTIVYDTTGLVDPGQGGLALKYAKIDLLNPEAVIAIQIDSELEPLLEMLKRSGRTRLIRLRPSSAVVTRDAERRKHYRAVKFKRYFSRARIVNLEWRQYGIFPGPRFALNRLVALEDSCGMTLCLGIVTGLDRTARRVELLTPLEDLNAVRAIYLGGVLVDPDTYRDRFMVSQ